MKKDKEWLKAEVNRILRDKVSDGINYYDYMNLKNSLNELINQLDEPEVLSQEWIDSNSIYASSDGVTDEYVHVSDLENLLVPNQELPVIPKYVAEYLDFAKSDVSLMRVMELAHTRYELPKWEKEYDWISENSETFARAWLDGFTVGKEPKYYALIKGHENIDSDDKYWSYCITDKGLSIGDNKVHPDVSDDYILKFTQCQWGNLGINETNADFIPMEEETEC